MTWLQERAQPSAWAVMTTVFALYAQFSLGGGWQGHVALLTLALLVAQLARAPRWVTYGLLLVGFACVVGHDVFVAATGQQDPGADRDDAVEIACRAVLHAHNPWSKHTPLHNPISTGPASILVALPFVALTGGIVSLTFLFWMLVAGCAIAGDRARRRDAAVVMIQLLQLGLFDTHTMRYWALDELSFAVPLFLVAWQLAIRRRYALTGVILAATLLWRASYALPVLGFLAWLRWEADASWRRIARVVVACAATCAATALVLVACFWRTIGHANPIGIALDKAVWPVEGGSDLTAVLGWLSEHVSSRILGPLRVAFAGVLVVGGGRLLARLRLATPLAYVTLGNLVAFTVVHYAGRFADNFSGPVVISAVLAIAFAETPGPPAPASPDPE
jgi:hypothetical protein